MVETVSIDGTDYESYVSLETADAYLNAAQHGATWRAQTDDDEKGRAIVTAVRILDRQIWKGERNPDASPTSQLEWPRINTGVEGVEDNLVPQDILDATCELALFLMDGSAVQTDPAAQTKETSSLKAGSVSISYFKGAITAEKVNPDRFPLPVQELVQPYLGGSGVAVCGAAYGTDGESVTEEDFGFTGGG